MSKPGHGDTLASRSYVIPVMALIFVFAIVTVGVNHYHHSSDLKQLNRQPRIINGERYRPHYKHPVVLIRMHNVKNGRTVISTCTGTILNSNYILTAAHCFTEELHNKTGMRRKHDLDITIYIGLKNSRQMRLLEFYNTKNMGLPYEFSTSQVIEMPKPNSSNAS